MVKMEVMNSYGMVVDGNEWLSVVMNGYPLIRMVINGYKHVNGC